MGVLYVRFGSKVRLPMVTHPKVLGVLPWVVQCLFEVQIARIIHMVCSEQGASCFV